MLDETDNSRPYEDLLAQTRWLGRLAAQLVPPADREDLVQDVLLSAMRREDEPLHLRRWLATVARNLAARRRSRERNRKCREQTVARDVDAVPSAADAVATFAAHRAVVNAVMELEEPYRNSVLLHFWEDLPPREVARRTGVPVETARTRIKRGVDRLRKQLDHQAGERRAWVAPLLQIGAVREAFLSGTAAVAPMALSTILTGVLAMKKATLVAAAVALAFASVAMFNFRGDDSGAGDAAGSEGTLVVKGASATTGTLSGEQAMRAVRLKLPADTRPGAVLVRVHYHNGMSAADIGVYMRASRGNELGAEQRTGKDGMVTFTGLDSGEYRVLLDRGGEQTISVVAGQQSDCTLHIAKGVTVRGRVVTMAKQPVSGARVYALQKVHHDLMAFLAKTDSAGAFVLRDAAPGLQLFARANGWQPTGPRHGRRVRGRPGESVEVEIELGARGYGLRGQVLDANGHPAPHAQVGIAVDEDCRKRIDGLERVRGSDSNSMLDRETFFVRADAQGRFSTREVPWGDAAVLARGAGSQEHLVGGARVRVNKGDANHVLVHLSIGAVVYGTVRDEDGKPYEGITLHAEFRGTAELGELERGFGHYLADRTCVTATDGSYKLDGLFEAEQLLSRLLPTGKQRIRKLEVIAGQELRLDLNIARTWQLRVLVQDDDGTPLEGWAVMLSGSGSISYNLVDRTLTGADGVHVATGLRAERYVLTVHAPDPVGKQRPRRFPSFLRKVTRGDNQVVAVVSTQMGKIRGRILDSKGNLVARSSVKLSPMGSTEVERGRSDSDGRFTIEHLPAGEYELDIHANGPHLKHRYRLAVGEEKDLGELFLPAPAPLLVSLRAKDGKPIEPADMRLLSRHKNNETGKILWRLAASGRARNAEWRCDNVVEGEYLLQVSGEDIAAQARRIRLIAGVPKVLKIDCARGVAQSFELTLLANPQWRHATLEIYDMDGNEILSKYVRIGLADSRQLTLRTTIRMLPGKYLVALQEPRLLRQGKTTDRAATRIEIPTGSGSPIRIVMR